MQTRGSFDKHYMQCFNMKKTTWIYALLKKMWDDFCPIYHEKMEGIMTFKNPYQDHCYACFHHPAPNIVHLKSIRHTWP